MNIYGQICIKEFMYSNIDDSFQLVEIFDNVTGETLYKGMYSDMPKEYEDYIVGSWNCIANCGVCFNVDIEEQYLTIDYIYYIYYYISVYRQIIKTKIEN